MTETMNPELARFWGKLYESTDLSGNEYAAIRLIQVLYELDAMGGPLHVQLDDGNLDGDMDPTYGAPDRYTSSGTLIPGYPDRHPPVVHEICDAISELMTPMSTEQRIEVRRHALRWVYRKRTV